MSGLDPETFARFKALYAEMVKDHKSLEEHIEEVREKALGNGETPDEAAIVFLAARALYAQAVTGCLPFLARLARVEGVANLAVDTLIHIQKIYPEIDPSAISALVANRTKERIQ